MPTGGTVLTGILLDLQLCLVHIRHAYRYN